MIMANDHHNRISCSFMPFLRPYFMQNISSLKDPIFQEHMVKFKMVG